jgi:hypothetical protein
MRGILLPNFDIIFGAQQPATTAHQVYRGTPRK